MHNFVITYLFQRSVCYKAHHIIISMILNYRVLICNMFFLKFLSFIKMHYGNTNGICVTYTILVYYVYNTKSSDQNLLKFHLDESFQAQRRFKDSTNHLLLIKLYSHDVSFIIFSISRN